MGGDFEHATSSVTPDATSKDEGGLHPPRRGLASWLGDMRERVQLDPRRWTAVGWANAAYLVLVVLLVVVVSPPEDDGSGSFFFLGLVILILARAAFVWAWNRRHGGGTAARVSAPSED